MLKVREASDLAEMSGSRTGIPYLEGDKLVVHHHFLRQKISADRGLVLIAEFLVHILVHQAGLTDAAVAQDNDLQQNLLSGGHLRLAGMMETGLACLLYYEFKKDGLPVRGAFFSRSAEK
jgi:hypothetical protein